VKFPRYWTRVKNESGLVVARGWSETSHDEALVNAKARLNRILDYLRSDKPLDDCLVSRICGFDSAPEAFLAGDTGRFRPFHMI